MSPRVFVSELRLYVANHVVNAVPSHRLRHIFYRAAMRFDVDPTASILLGTTFDAPHGLAIGRSSVIGRRCRIDTRGGIWIGRNVSISDDVTILTADHDVRAVAFDSRERPVHLADFVFIGARAVILPGCMIGEGGVVAAGSVLTKDIPAYEIWGGCPASKLGDRPHSLSYSTLYRRPFN